MSIQSSPSYRAPGPATAVDATVSKGGMAVERTVVCTEMVAVAMIVASVIIVPETSLANYQHTIETTASSERTTMRLAIPAALGDRGELSDFGVQLLQREPSVSIPNAREVTSPRLLGAGAQSIQAGLSVASGQDPEAGPFSFAPSVLEHDNERLRWPVKRDSAGSLVEITDGHLARILRFAF